MYTTQFKFGFLSILLFCICIVSNAHTIPQTLAEFHEVYADRYDLIIPKQETNAKLPLYIILPGGVGKKKYPNFRDRFIKPSVKERGIIFSPKVAWKKCNLSILEQTIKDFIVVASNTMNIDQNKIVLVGYSNGGMQSLQLAQTNESLFSNVVVISSTFKFTQKMDTPIHIIHGSKDRYFRIHRALKEATRATEMGCDITFVTAEERTDYNPAAYIPEFSEFVTKL